VTVLVNRGVEEATNGDKSRAVTLFRRALLLDSTNDTALLWLAWLSESPHESVELLERIVALKPNNHIAKVYLQQAKAQRNELDEASNNLAVEEIEETESPALPIPIQSPATFLGDYLISKGYITAQQLEEALNYQKVLDEHSRHKLIGQLLVGLGHLSQKQLSVALQIRQDEEGYTLEEAG
jgi:hypothetical protein